MRTARLRVLKRWIDLVATLSAFVLCFATIADIGLSTARQEPVDRFGQVARYAVVRLWAPFQGGVEKQAFFSDPAAGNSSLD